MTKNIDKIEAQKLYDSGFSFKKLANHFDVSVNVIFKLKLNNVRNIYGPKNINIVEAQELYDSGLSLRKLAMYYNVSLGTITKLDLKTRTVKEANVLSIERGERKFTKDGLQKLSFAAKEKNLGGYRPHPNKGKYYKDIWFDSNFEIITAKSLDENDIKWERPKVGFVWNDSGNKYYPDFYLPEFGVYLDPKNDFLIEKDKIKISESEKRNSIKVFVLDKHNLEWDKINALISQWKTTVLV